MIGFPSSAWRASSRSSGSGGQCVEVAVTSAAVGVRDSKDRGAGHFAVAPGRWMAFTARVKTGAFDL